MPIGDRLRSERERLGLSQTEFGQSAGVGRKSQFNYESDERLPDAAYLAAVAGLGVDVRYVITGRRDYSPPPTLSSEERTLLELWRAASHDTRKAAMGALVGASTRGSVKMNFEGPVGAVYRSKGNVNVGGSTMNVNMPAKPGKTPPKGGL